MPHRRFQLIVPGAHLVQGRRFRHGGDARALGALDPMKSLDLADLALTNSLDAISSTSEAKKACQRTVGLKSRYVELLRSWDDLELLHVVHQRPAPRGTVDPLHPSQESS